MALLSEILQGQTMKEKLARPTASAATRMSNSMESADPALGYMKGGEWLSAITNGLKTGLGFYGAIKDAKAQDAYNQQLAELAAQERADKQAQQAFENDYKNRELSQKETLQQGQFANAKDIAQMNIDAANARAKVAREQALYDADVKRQQALEDAARNREYAIADRNLAREQALQDMQLKREQTIADRAAQQAQEQAIYDRNRADALADRAAQQEYELGLYNKKNADAQKSEMLKGLDAVAQKRLTAEDYALWRRNPDAFEITGDGWLARKVGRRATLKPNLSFMQTSDEDLFKGL